MKIKSKFWPVFVEATFGGKPKTYWLYLVACVLSVIVAPIAWITLLANILTMRSWRGSHPLSRPFPFVLGIMIMPICAVVGGQMWVAVFPFPPEHMWNSVYSYLSFMWLMTIPGLVGVTVAMFVMMFIGALVSAPIAKFTDWVQGAKIGTEVTYESDDSLDMHDIIIEEESTPKADVDDEITG